VIFTPSSVEGAYVIDIEPAHDERGFFARTFCVEELEAHGLRCDVSQCSVSFNRKCHTLRGMHYQVAPHVEAKIVSCHAGAIRDVIVDLRPESPTHRRWFGVELSAANRRMLYVPPLVAHGFLTLEDDSEVHYAIMGSYSPECARGVRFNDRALGIEWPAPPEVISERDRTYPDYGA